MLIALILGAFLGFISAIPVAGPVSAIIFSRGMAGKFAEGRWVAAGAGLVEGIYAFVAFWGFTHFLADLSWMTAASNGLAAVILAGLAVYFFRSKKMRKPSPESRHASASGPRGLLVGAGVSAINPSLIASWTIVITSLSSMKFFEFTLLNAVFFSGGICGGIIIWFALLLALMAKHRNNLNPKFLDRGLKAIGLFLGALSLGMIYKLAKMALEAYS
jgi:threonine/homoserine/homoserine lactone efflux protein